jgi:hypothetical protein
MKRSSLLFTSGSLFVLAIAGCQAIAGIQSRATDPLLSGCNLPGVGTTPATGAGRIRLVNLATTTATGNADFCVRTSGSTNWGRPVFRDGGDDALCRGGLKYQQSTVPFSVPLGKLDVKAIPATKSCDTPATSELDGITIADATPVTVVRWGNAAREKIAALREEPGSQSSVASAFRVVNALASASPINVGLAADAFVPTTVTPSYANPILPGGVEPGGLEGIGTVDAEGYLGFASLTLKLGISNANDPSNSAIVVFDTHTRPETSTLYVVGDPADNGHPVQGLYCQDAISQSSETVDAGPSSSALTQQDLALLAECVPTQPPLISVDTFNVGLYGGDAPFPDQRAPAIYAAIAARTSDVMCVVEVDSQSDRTNIATNAAAHFPNVYTFTSDLDTKPTLPADVSTNPPTVAPCDPSLVPAATITNIFNCVNQNCSTNLNDPNYSGTLAGSDNCLTYNCARQFQPIYQGGPNRTLPYATCFDCIALYLTSEQPLAAGRTACTTDPRPALAFLGQTPEMILSHYPLSNQHAYVLPSSGFQRAVLQATVTLENNQKFDFFCAQLTSPLLFGANGGSLPYVGNYGPSYTGWEQQQQLQMSEVIAFVQQQAKADGLPAIVTGDWHSTDGAADAGPGQLGSVSPEVIDAIEMAPGFVEAVPADYVPTCDFCPKPQNPFNTKTPPLEFMRTFLVGFPGGSTYGKTLWGIENSVTLIGTANEPGPNGEVGPSQPFQAPLSEYYPSNVTVLRPSAK